MTMTREEWLAARKTGIGASDIAAICGLSPWATPLDVYIDKTSDTPDRKNQAMMWGLRLESALAAAYTEETGVALERASFTRHPDMPWVCATPDYRASDRLVQLKVARTSEGFGDAGTDQIPEYYLCQTSWEMLAAEYPRDDLAVLIGGVDFRIYPTYRNEQLIRSLLDIGRDFWKRVQDRNPPDVDWSDPRTPDVIALLHKPIDGLEVILDDDALLYALSYEQWGDEARKAEQNKKEAKARLIERMGEASVGLLPDGREVRRKLISKEPYTVTPEPYWDFRLAKTPKRKLVKA